MKKEKRKFHLKEFLMKYSFVIIIILVFVYFSLVTDNFCTAGNIISMLHTAAPNFIFAAGAAMIIVTGKVDLSIGSVMYLATAVFTVLIENMKINIVSALLGALVAGLAVGIVNGLLVVLLKVTPMIATMGTMIAVRGIARTVSGGMPLSLPENIRGLGTYKIGPIFLDIIIAFIVLILMYILHSRTKFGRLITAIGNDEKIAVKLGINVPKIIVLDFMLSALLATISGLLLSFQVGGVTLAFGQGKEFTAIAICVIGGFSMFGGTGHVLKGLPIGVMTLTIIEAGLNFMGVSPYAYQLVQGGIIFIAMYAQSYQSLVQIKKKKNEEIAET
ncbi:ABC transporter permease [Mediterraneibacter sp. NSJ-55]|uniref:ABC transporter permease n=1 Tax=Mediterraneibacter hominis TaxID=2763054 RepID=A0A923LKR7_9FIRM|nr:ABC transporter permease [Mediterraneibacter hominis]MBC5689862.1 ABC transporter permease [Mediterraneibacter hominis]